MKKRILAATAVMCMFWIILSEKRLGKKVRLMVFFNELNSSIVTNEEILEAIMNIKISVHALVVSIGVRENWLQGLLLVIIPLML